ncbi:MAG: hypothetical protein IJ706_04760 [Clostridia bacterium]|nr:hypothetical protein [Clostridia bacterium]
MEQKPNEKPEIVVPKGYELDDLIDTDDNGYGFKQEAIYTGEASVKVDETYTNEGETVLDNCIGSGSTIVACINTNRHYIGFDLKNKYLEVVRERIEKVRIEKGGCNEKS